LGSLWFGRVPHRSKGHWPIRKLKRIPAIGQPALGGDLFGADESRKRILKDAERHIDGVFRQISKVGSESSHIARRVNSFTPLRLGYFTGERRSPFNVSLVSAEVGIAACVDA